MSRSPRKVVLQSGAMLLAVAAVSMWALGETVDPEGDCDAIEQALLAKAGNAQNKPSTTFLAAGGSCEGGEWAWLRDEDRDAFPNANGPVCCIQCATLSTPDCREAASGHFWFDPDDGEPDCNDDDPGINPNADEIVADGIDQDCDGRDRCWVDADGDGVGGTNVASPTTAPWLDCDAHAGLSSTNGDACDAEPSLLAPVDWFADCDGDGYPGNTIVSACSAEEAFPNCSAVTQGNTPWTLGLDCADHDATTRGSPFWVADCDHDGHPGEPVQEACSELEAAEAFATRPPTSAYCTSSNVYKISEAPEYECADDAQNHTPLIETWYADCDKDGYFGTEGILACNGEDARARFAARRADCVEDTVFSVLRNPTNFDCDDTTGTEGGPQAWYADCDDDGAFGLVSIEACSAAEALASFAEQDGCGNIDRDHITTEPVPVFDCDDRHPEWIADQVWYADCDGDGFHGPDSKLACTPQDAVAAFRTSPSCDELEPGAVTTTPSASVDCNDTNADEFPGQVWYADCDDDGAYGTLETVTSCLASAARSMFANWCAAILQTPPLDPVIVGSASSLPARVLPGAPTPAQTDCWDGSSEWHPGAVWRGDCDGDGTFGSATYAGCNGAEARTALCPDPPADACVRPDYAEWRRWYRDVTSTGPSAVDCSDTECRVWPGSTDPTPGRDWNCDGTVSCYADNDNDGYGAGSLETLTGLPGGSCDAFLSPRRVAVSGDCDDNAPSIHPGAIERVADDIDQDCDGWDLCWYDGDGDGFGRDADGDGYDDGGEAYDPSQSGYEPGTPCSVLMERGLPVSTESNDCDDQNPAYFPGQLWHPDCDGDGHPRDVTFAACNDVGAMSIAVCPGNKPPENVWYVTATFIPDFDCLDDDPLRYPGSNKTCVGGGPGPCEVCEVDVQLDDDCNGDVNTAGPTGAISASNPPGANLLVEAWVDFDQDGFGSDSSPTLLVCTIQPGLSVNNLDCDDRDKGTRPGAYEICDLKDQNCNGTVDEAEAINVDDPEGASCIVLYRDRDRDGTGDPTHARCVCPERRSSPLPYVPLDEDDTGLFDPVQPPDPLRGYYAGDVYVAPPTDCDDNHPDIRPHECNDGLDNDGDGFIDMDDAGCLVGAADGRRSASESNRARTQRLHPDKVLVVRERIDGHDNECDGYVPIVELDCDDDGSFPLLAPDAPTTFEHASEIGLTPCNPADPPPALDCWGEPMALECDPVSGLWRIRYGSSEDGFGGRFSGGFRNLVSPLGCDRTGDCDDHCPNRCPSAPEVCDGVDNDCTLLNADGRVEGTTAGIPAALDPAVWLAGTVVAAELDFDGDGHASCTEDFLDQESEVHVAPRTCDAFPDTVLRSDCNDLCFATNPSATEVCNGFVDVCGARASEREGFDDDRDGHADCGAYGPEGSITEEEAYVPVWFDCTAPETLPSTLQRACAGVTDPVDASPAPGRLVPLLPPRPRAPACDAELTEALVALARRTGRADAETWVASARSPDLVRQFCAPNAPTGGACSVVRISILEDGALAEANETPRGDLRLTHACRAAPEQHTVRTVWSRPRIVDARKGVVELECLRLFGTTCDRITASTPRTGIGAPPDVDVLLEPSDAGDTGTLGPDDAPFWLELGRFGPSTAPGATMTCWGDPRVESVATRTGGDCDDSSGQAHRDLPEGPHDIVLAYEGENGDCSRCVDGIDNNCDGLTDCEDPTCAICFVGQGQGCAGARDACAVPSGGDEKGCNTTRARGLALLLALPLVAWFGRRRPRH